MDKPTRPASSPSLKRRDAADVINLLVDNDSHPQKEFNYLKKEFSKKFANIKKICCCQPTLF
jgi:hypothetical protein